ncbi:MAG: adenylyl-sulfate kinase [Caldilineaceae bacterium]|nr:adenylyl-sulfate kinase [Caldilineaceae bacterium]
MTAHSVEPGFAIWFTGLPAAGKTTLARAVQVRLAAAAVRTELLDSDELRRRLVPGPTYTADERDWFYDLIVFLAELLTRNGVNVLIAATAQRRIYRATARSKLDRFAEVYVECPPEVCRARDPKGLWAMADRGEIHGLPGADAIYEAPLAPEVTVRSAIQGIDASAREILHALGKLGWWAHTLPARQIDPDS